VLLDYRKLPRLQSYNITAKCCFHPVNPVFSVVVANAAIEGVWSQYKDEMSGVADAAEKVVVELPGTELLDIEENGETTQL